ncbi:hypothetical protein BTUL_0015g00380 [Botrytis tulipae]|uniref:Uncharacterized protein n=1 Tax=Botrytis tulipae TaxID=87230 RepID=A0A4Z1F3X1_9HELO|nr:hypothetical protein BTUL_0015g00380 [Botrytis tulipae]
MFISAKNSQNKLQHYSLPTSRSPGQKIYTSKPLRKNKDFQLYGSHSSSPLKATAVLDAAALLTTNEAEDNAATGVLEARITVLDGMFAVEETCVTIAAADEMASDATIVGLELRTAEDTGMLDVEAIVAMEEEPEALELTPAPP